MYMVVMFLLNITSGFEILHNVNLNGNMLRSKYRNII